MKLSWDPGLLAELEGVKASFWRPNLTSRSGPDPIDGCGAKI